MNYFPMFFNLKDKVVLICGGGKHAIEKIERLMPFSPIIRVISESISPEIKEIEGLSIHERPFSQKDLECAPAFVVAAEEYCECKRISDICKKYNIPVNTVDIPTLCDFIFPSIIATEQLCIGISTGGASPTAAIKLKQQITELIPSSIDEILSWMLPARELVKKALPKDKQKRALQLIVQKAFSEDRVLEDEELTNIIRSV